MLGSSDTVVTRESPTSDLVPLVNHYRPSRGVRVPSLKYYRTQLALSQEDLAHKAGVGRSTVGRGESGDEIRPSSLRRLARALRVSTAALQQQPPA